MPTKLFFESMTSTPLMPLSSIKRAASLIDASGDIEITRGVIISDAFIDCLSFEFGEIRRDATRVWHVR
jgi:hypothetical protein